MMHIANVILNSLQDKHDKVEHKRVHSQCENVELEQNPTYVGLSTHNRASVWGVWRDSD